MPAGRVAGAARERGDEPRPREPLSLRFKDRLEKRPSMSEILWLVTEMGTNVKRRVAMAVTASRADKIALRRRFDAII
jgi:hypothetical protein